MISEGGFGRPEDKDIERQFMKKIRGDKLQAINAQCELEISLAFRTDSKKEHKPSKNKRAKKKQPEENCQMMENLVLAILIGNLNSDRRELLRTKFKQLKQAWKFQQINENQPLPDYFFQDGCDLSYILYELQKTGQEQFKVFTAEDLIFLELLCLQGRKLLNENIIKEYAENMNYMILAMKNGLQKIQQRLNIYRAQVKSKQRKISNEEGVEVQFQSSFEVANNTESKQEKKLKTKKIKKGAKGKKKSKKGNDSDSQQENMEDDSQSEITYPKQKQLALKTCNYISWAYWYIINKE